jgi:predicted ATPase
MTARRNGALTQAADASSHLQSLEIKDFKSLKQVSIELGQINVFVGANGAGKSNLLEAVGILGACASGVVDDQSLARRGVRPGVPELYKSSFEGEKMAPMISLGATSVSEVKYHAYITNPADRPLPQWLFSNESLSLSRKLIASRSPRGNATALGLSMPVENNRSVTALVRASQEAPLEVRGFLAALDDFAIFAPVTPILRGIAPDPAQRGPVGLFGGQLPEAVALLQSVGGPNGPLDVAYTLIDWASKISVGQPSRRFLSPSVPTSRYVLEFRDLFMAKRRNTLSGYDASEGALYVLFMLVLAVHGQSPSILAIDNFDQALNPRTARALTRVFVASALENGRQVFLTTHNPLVLDGLALDDPRVRLFTVSRDPEGHTKVNAVPVRNLAALKKKHGEFALSNLWIAGRLGGMPKDV